jgi:hypothetical protein
VFSISTADVELPGEFLMPKSNIVCMKAITLSYDVPQYVASGVADYNITMQ